MVKHKETFARLIDDSVLSPFFHTRKLPIELIVLHKIALPLHNPSLDFVCKFFQGKASYRECAFLKNLPQFRVSSHFVIGKDGRVVKCVNPKDFVAWHCGYSFFKGRFDCNEFSIGIEFVGFETEDLTEAQYRVGGALIESLKQDFNISQQNIVGHREISLGRKTDPGYYNKERLLLHPFY